MRLNILMSSNIVELTVGYFLSEIIFFLICCSWMSPINEQAMYSPLFI